MAWAPLVGGAVAGLGSAMGGKKANKPGQQFSIPRDTQGARNSFLNMLNDYFRQPGEGILGRQNPLTQATWGSMREMLSPDYWQTALKSPDEYLANYTSMTRPAWETDLSHALDAEQAKLGGQYGLRFSSEMMKAMGRTSADALGRRQAQIAGLYPSLLGEYNKMFQFKSQLPLQIEGIESNERWKPIEMLMQFATSYPGASQVPQYSPVGMGLQTAGSMAMQYPLYKYIYDQTGTQPTTSMNYNYNYPGAWLPDYGNTSFSYPSDLYYRR